MRCSLQRLWCILRGINFSGQADSVSTTASCRLSHAPLTKFLATNDLVMLFRSSAACHAGNATKAESSSSSDSFGVSLELNMSTRLGLTSCRTTACRPTERGCAACLASNKLGPPYLLHAPPHDWLRSMLLPGPKKTSATIVGVLSDAMVATRRAGTLCWAVLLQAQPRPLVAR